MALEECPRCGYKLTLLQSSGRQICSSCGWTDKPKQVAVDSSLKGEVAQGIIGLVVLIGIFGGCVANITSPRSVSNSRPDFNSTSPGTTRNSPSSEDTRDFTSPEDTRNEAYSSLSSDWENYQKADDPATRLVKSCASKAGISENDPKHAITPYEMQELTDCIDRNR